MSRFLVTVDEQTRELVTQRRRASRCTAPANRPCTASSGSRTEAAARSRARCKGVTSLHTLMPWLPETDVAVACGVGQAMVDARTEAELRRRALPELPSRSATVVAGLRRTKREFRERDRDVLGAARPGLGDAAQARDSPARRPRRALLNQRDGRRLGDAMRERPARFERNLRVRTATDAVARAPREGT